MHADSLNFGFNFFATHTHKTRSTIMFYSEIGRFVSNPCWFHWQTNDLVLDFFFFRLLFCKRNSFTWHVFAKAMLCLSYRNVAVDISVFYFLSLSLCVFISVPVYEYSSWSHLLLSIAIVVFSSSVLSCLALLRFQITHSTHTHTWTVYTSCFVVCISNDDGKYIVCEACGAISFLLPKIVFVVAIV